MYLADLTVSRIIEISSDLSIGVMDHNELALYSNMRGDYITVVPFELASLLTHLHALAFEMQIPT